MLSTVEIENIAGLSRIALADAEKERLAQQLSEVIEYFKKLQQLDTSTVDLNLSETENTNQTRQDKREQNKDTEKILENAPMREGSFIKVRSVF